MHHLQRQHTRRQAASAPGTGTPAELRQQCLPALAIMKQQQRIAAAGLGIGAKQLANTRAQIGHGRRQMGERPGRADRGTTAATHAQVRLDFDLITLRFDRASGTSVDAGSAAALARATMGADARVVTRHARLVELAHQGRQAAQSQRLIERITTGRDIALRQMRSAQQRRVAQIEHQIEALLAARVAVGGRGLQALEIDRADLATRRHASAMRLTQCGVDLIVEADGAFGTGANTGIAARAQFQIDGIAHRPAQLERAQPATE